MAVSRARIKTRAENVTRLIERQAVTPRRFLEAIVQTLRFENDTTTIEGVAIVTDAKGAPIRFFKAGGYTVESVALNLSQQARDAGLRDVSEYLFAEYQRRQGFTFRVVS